MRATLKLKYPQTFPSLHFVNFKQGLMKAKLCLYKYDKQVFNGALYLSWLFPKSCPCCPPPNLHLRAPFCNKKCEMDILLPTLWTSQASNVPVGSGPISSET